MIISNESIISILISLAAAFIGIFIPPAEDEFEAVELLPEPPAQTEPVEVDVSGNDILWYKTHDYFGGFGMGEAALIRSKKELSQFYESYGKHDELKKFVKGIDFSETALAYEMVTLTSGSIGCEFNGAIISDGKVRFSYKLIYPEIGTCDMAMIYLFAKIPVSELNESAKADGQM